MRAAVSLLAALSLSAQEAPKANPAAPSAAPADKPSPRAKPSEALLHPERGGQLVGGETVQGMERSKDPDIAINVANARLYDLIHQIGQLRKLNYTIDPAVKDGPVRIFMHGKLEKDNLEDVLSLALKLHGVAVVRNGDFLEFIPLQASKASAPLVYGSQPVEEVGNTFAVTQVVPLRFIDAESFATFAKDLLTQDGRVLADKQRNWVLATDYQTHVRRLLAFAELMDQPPFERQDYTLIRLMHASPEGVAKELEPVLKAMNVPVGSAVKIVPLQSLSALLVVCPKGDLGKWLGELKPWMDRFDEKPTTVSGELFILPLKHAKAETVFPVLTQVLRLQGSAQAGNVNRAPTPALSRPGNASPYPTFGSTAAGLPSAVPQAGAIASNASGTSPSPAAGSSSSAVAAVPPASATGGGILSSQASITMETSNNSLIIFGTQQDYRLIENAVAKLDVMPRQVLIEATILDLVLTGEFELGFQGYLRRNYNPGEINVNGFQGDPLTQDWRIDRGASNGAFTYTLMSATRQGLLNLVLNAKDSRTNTRILSSPQVWALDNQPAQLSVQDNIPIAVNTYIPGTGGSTGSNGYSVTNAQYITTGLSLVVTPHINGSGVVRLEVQQEISTSTGVENLGSGSSQITAPRISNRSLKTELIAHSGQTLVLGGLIRDNKTDTTTGLPLLNRIPVLRHLFSSQSRINTRTELVILLTPHVVTTPEDSDKVAKELRNRVTSLTGTSK